MAGVKPSSITSLTSEFTLRRHRHREVQTPLGGHTVMSKQELTLLVKQKMAAHTVMEWMTFVWANIRAASPAVSSRMPFLAVILSFLFIIFYNFFC